jgi:hypothetical protein
MGVEKRAKEGASQPKKRVNSKGKDKAKSRSVVPVSSPRDTEIRAGKGDDTITIEVGKYGSVLQAVKELAEEELRPLSLQIIYMLRKQLASRKEERTG